jgi:hypothetical protein
VGFYCYCYCLTMVRMLCACIALVVALVVCASGVSALSFTVGNSTGASQSILYLESSFSMSIEADTTAPFLYAPVEDEVGCGGWDPVAYSAYDYSGAFMLISRGTCAFGLKAEFALAAGAIGAVLHNCSPDPPSRCATGLFKPIASQLPDILSIAISYEDAMMIRFVCVCVCVCVYVYVRIGTRKDRSYLSLWTSVWHRLTPCRSR